MKVGGGSGGMLWPEVWPHVERNLFLVRGLGDLSIPKAVYYYGAHPEVFSQMQNAQHHDFLLRNSVHYHWGVL